MWGKRKKAGGRKRRSSNRTCPFCEAENPSDATSCHQCYYELDVKAMHQSTSNLEDDEDTLWGELIQEVTPGEEEDFFVSVIVYRFVLHKNNFFIPSTQISKKFSDDNKNKNDRRSLHNLFG